MELIDLESGKRSEVRLRGGQKATILPNCAHRFRAEEESHVIEYYNGTYDPDDDLPCDGFSHESDDG